MNFFNNSGKQVNKTNLNWTSNGIDGTAEAHPITSTNAARHRLNHNRIRNPQKLFKKPSTTADLQHQAQDLSLQWIILLCSHSCSRPGAVVERSKFLSKEFFQTLKFVRVLFVSLYALAWCHDIALRFRNWLIGLGLTCRALQKWLFRPLTIILLPFFM